MRILMLSPTLPYPPHQGGALRNYGILYGLHKAGHQITLLSFSDGSTSPEVTPLVDLCECVVTVAFPARPARNRLRDLLTSAQPDLVQRLMSTEFLQQLIHLLKQTRFDLIQFEGLEMAAYWPTIRQYQPQARLCYDAHNAEYQLQQGIFAVDRRALKRLPTAFYSYIQARRIARVERDFCQTVDCVLAVSDEDAQALRDFRSDGRVAVIPNAIFTTNYNHNRDQLDLGPHVLTFTGKMDYRPNVDAMLWFTGEILPRVLAVIPDAHLYIVGQKPHPRLESLRSTPAITLTGWVPEIHPFLKATDVYIAPLRMGSGTRLKLLEAMAAGCAVVATSSAAAGLPEEAHDALIQADNVEAFAQAIIRLLKTPAQREKLGQAAQALVETHYDWSVVIPRLLDVYRDIGIG